MHHDDIHVLFVSDHECAQVDGGNIESLVTIGIDAMEEIMMCAALNLLGVPCGG